MIRLGLPILGQGGWQGGRNYLLNLLRAVQRAAPDVTPVLLADAETRLDPALEGLEVHRRRGALASASARRAGGLFALAAGRDLVEESWLRDAEIDVYSHGRPISGAVIPNIFWLGDLQHRTHPQMFRRRDRWLRDLAFGQALRNASVVFASSETSRAEMIEAYGRSAERVRVLRFATAPTLPLGSLDSVDTLARALGIGARWIHLPNQFWKHKNHDIVVDALASAPDVLVVATGPKHDFRNPGHFDRVMRRAADAGVADRFRYLGLVDDQTQLALMRHAVAILNPSWSEGWSTSVEEAKALGKRVLLSDLAVHREQAPPRGVYFPPHDARSLSRALLDVWHAGDVDDILHVDRAVAAAQERVLAYGAAYRALIADAQERPRRGRR